MERTKVASSLIVFVLVMNLIPLLLIDWTPFTMVISEEPKVIANDPHGPIAIEGDANFSATALAEGWSGDGSAQDPYIIENYDITIGPTPEASIRITNTRVNFTIRGCNLIGPAATPSFGIFLENSTNGRIINNLITNFAHGLNVSGGSTNLVVTGNNISYNSYGIWWDDSAFPTITQNHCSHNFFTGIYISDSNEGTISGNNCSGNGNNGIHLYYISTYHILTDNICNENSWNGFRLEGAIENTLENNTSNENEVGIYSTGSPDNSIQWNVFKNNSLNNMVSDGMPSILAYNYWSDYGGLDGNGDGIGDTNYFASGDIDPQPLMFPPFPVEWGQTPIDQQIEFGTYFLYDISINCPAPYMVKVNDSTNFWTGVPTLSTNIILAVGDYPLTVNVTNIYGYFTEAVFTVRVRDTTPPIMTHPDDLSFRVDEITDHQVQWTLSDLSPLMFSLLRNGTEVTSHDTPTTPIFLTHHFDDSLGPGVYNYTMVAEDIWGNVATDMVLVTITPLPLLEVMLPWLIVGGVAVVVVIVAVVILKKRKPKSTE